jgi:oligoribonuclease NrnB/cAMP/cGMP phosphodiesterase (DHH superfamily)
MNPLILCIYHGNCADGFTAAWVVRRALGADAVDFYPGVYQRPPPDVTDRDVIFVDFCYKKEIMLELAKKAKSIMVLDHHKSAAIDMNDVKHVWGFSRTDWESMVRYGDPFSRVMLEFDMNRSGAGLTWDFFNPGEPRPKLIDHVEDRDLWKFKLPNTREIQACLFSYPYDFEVWDSLIEGFEHPNPRNLMIDGGIAIERKHFKDIEELILVSTRPMRLGGYLVPVANLPYTMTSDAGHILCSRNFEGRKSADPNDPYKQPFAATYYDTPNGRQFSLRSEPGGVDVSEIAVQYGGGGHARAAGFLRSYSLLSDFEP